MELTREDRKKALMELNDGHWDDWYNRFISLQEAWYQWRNVILEADPFLAKTITDVIYLNSDNKRVRGENVFPPFSQPAKTVIQFDHIEVELIPAQPQQNAAEKLKASNLQLKLKDAKTANDFEKVISEKVKTALSLAHLAKNSGWKTVNLGDTQDVVDKLILVAACSQAGLNLSIPNMDNELKAFFPEKKNSKVTCPGCPFLNNEENPAGTLRENIKDFTKKIEEEDLFTNLGFEPPQYQTAESDDDFESFLDGIEENDNDPITENDRQEKYDEEPTRAFRLEAL